MIFQFGEIDVTGISFEGEVYDVTGVKIGTLRAGPDASTLLWDGKNESSTVVPGGIYIYQITAGGKTVNGSVVVAR